MTSINAIEKDTNDFIKNDDLFSEAKSYLGGSATVVISDARVSGSMKIVGNLNVAVNDVYVKRIEPGTGQVTFHCSGDPGVSTFYYFVDKRI